MAFDRAVDHEGWPVDANGLRAPWADMTSSTPRGAVYQKIVIAHRVPRATPRANLSGNAAWSDPAPDWCWKLVRGILEHTEAEPDYGERIALEALAWCKAGDEETRAGRLLSIAGATRPTLGPLDDVRFLGELRRLLAEAWQRPQYLPKK